MKAISRKITSSIVYLTFVFLACCSSFQPIAAFASAADTLEKTTLHLRWHHQFQFAGYYAAIEKGFYADEGLDVELLEIRHDTGMIAPIINGTADYGIADGSLLAARAKGTPVVLLAQIFQHSPQVFLSLRETEIYTPHDIRGKKAMFDASDASLNLLFFETLGGTDSFEIIPQSNNLNDLIDGKVQLVSAYLANEPYQLRKRGIEFNILHPRGYGIDYFGDNLFTSETELRNNPQRVKKMIRATLKGWQYALKNKNEIIDLIINNYAPNADRGKLIYEAQVIEQMILPDLIPVGEIDLLRLKEIAKGYTRLGETDSAEIPEGFIYREDQQQSKIDLTFEEQAWLKAHPQITLGTGQDWSPYIIVAADGTLFGIEADLIKRINEIAGTNITIILGERLDIVEKAKAKEIDGLLVSSAQEKTAPYFLFTNSLYSTYKYIFTTTLNVKSMDDLKGKRVAYQRSIPIHKKFLTKHPEIIAVPADSNDVQALLLQNNEVDAVIGGNIFKYYLQDRMLGAIHPEYIVPESKVDVVYSIRKDWPELHSIINKALAQISPAERTGIVNKWIFTPDTAPNEQVPLSKNERAWLKAHPHITLTSPDNFEPYLITTPDGTKSGILVDFLAELNRRLGIKIQLSTGTLKDNLPKVTKGEKDGVLALSPDYADVLGLLKTRNYFTTYPAIFTRNGLTLNTPADLAGKIIVHREAEYFSTKIIDQYGQNAKRITVDNALDGLLMVNKGDADVFVGLSGATYLLTKYQLSSLSSKYVFFDAPIEVAIAVKPGLPELIPILNKGLASFSENEINALVAKWIQFPDQKPLAILTPEEQVWLQKHSEIKFGFTDTFPPYQIKTSGGKNTGVMIDILSTLNEKLGSNFGVDVDSWSKKRNKNQENQLAAVLTVAGETAETNDLLKSETVFSVYPSFFVREDALFTLTKLDDLRGKSVGIRQSAGMMENILEPYQDQINIKRYTTNLEMLEALIREEVDIAFDWSSNNYLITKYNLSGIRPIYTLFNKPANIVFDVRSDLPELLTIINKGLVNTPPTQLERIKAKWFNTQARNSFTIVLTAAEQAWLEKKRTIQVRVTNFPPYIIPQKDGPPKGIAIDSLNLITDRTGVEFNFVSSEQTFKEALDGIKSHQGPDVIATIVRTAEREKSILFTRDFLKSPWMIFMRADAKKITVDMDDLIGKKVALLKGGTLKDMIAKDYPEIKQALFDNHIKAIDAVTNKEAEAYIGNLTLTSYYLLQSGYYNLRIAAPSPFGDQVLSMGVRNDWPELASILDKGLMSISTEEQAAIRNKYISVHFDKSDTSEYIKWILIFAGAASGIILFFFFWNRILAKRVAVRTAELKESENKYRNVLESTSTVPWELDLQSGIFTFMGIQIENILGYPADSWTDIAVWAERVHPEDRSDAVLFCETETRKGQDHDFVYRSLHIDGSYRWIRDVVSVIEGKTGPEALVGFMNDITEQKELALEKEQLKKQWEQSQKLEAIGTLAGGIAHDFNNILSAILGFTDLAKESVPVGSEISDDLDEVLTAGHRAKKLVQQILAFSRQSQVNAAPLGPDLIVKEALKMLRSSIPTTIQIQEIIDQDCGTVVADPTQIHQIMMNLCTNAFHAMEEKGGTMTVELKRADFVPPDLTESALGYIELSVSDTGKGIDHETMDKIFDPFFTTKEQGKGTGMGLSIIYGIAKEYGGGVTVESELGKGTTLRVYLPRFEEEPASTPFNSTDIHGGSERILFVDDEQNITKMAKAMLEKSGYTVTVEMNSFEALKTFQNQPDAFDLVITDQTMPGMTGLDLSKRMLQKRPEIPIILCTGYSSIVNEDIAKAQGVREYISKPFSKNAMLSLIRTVLETN